MEFVFYRCYGKILRKHEQHISCKHRRTHIWRPTFRQVHRSQRESCCGPVNDWRRLAQLPLRLPLGLRHQRTGYTLNLTKVFIDVMAIIGLAYDLKTANLNAIKGRKLKSGDSTRVTRIEKPKHASNTKYPK
ncbi:hypothetical protein AVEN_152325-1 [Araneus ventricosus]|uniref:Uncharacterized protein n=1 Tax=Araneus ventricosus TaxID=182803 RepID=A0A4Y2FXD5_ARAVE|nr:hypothetical protein AVEN_152325-1 [Araneus ventricosus]